MKVEIMLNAALKLRFSKLTVNRTDVYDKILLLLQQLEIRNTACLNISINMEDNFCLLKNPSFC